MRVGGGDQLWGVAALAVAQVCLRAFDDHRWLAAIRGAVEDQIDAGVISGLPIADFGTDSAGTALKSPLEVNVSGALESEMTKAGVICLRRCKDTPYAALFSLPTLHRPRLLRPEFRCRTPRTATTATSGHSAPRPATRISAGIRRPSP